MATCIVSFVDTLGFRHTVGVQAVSLFEAGVLAIRAFKQNGCPPGYVSEMEVEIRSPVKHMVTPKRIEEWLEGGAKSQKEAVMKERVTRAVNARLLHLPSNLQECRKRGFPCIIP